MHVLPQRAKGEALPALVIAEACSRCDFLRLPAVQTRQRRAPHCCKGVLLYDESQIRLDMGGWQVSLYGDELTLCGVGGRMLTLKGKIFRAEFSNER